MGEPPNRALDPGTPSVSGRSRATVSGRCRGSAAGPTAARGFPPVVPTGGRAARPASLRRGLLLSRCERARLGAALVAGTRRAEPERHLGVADPRARARPARFAGCSAQAGDVGRSWEAESALSAASDEPPNAANPAPSTHCRWPPGSARPVPETRLPRVHDNQPPPERRSSPAAGVRRVSGLP